MKRRGDRSLCRNRGRCRIKRRGLAALDYFLTLGIVLPMATVALWAGPRILNLVYEMTTVLVSWPFP